jgi:RNA polymerase sigma-70 factor (ECF subfamily)
VVNSKRSAPHADEPDLAALVARAKTGDAAALDQLCRRCYDDVLWHFSAWTPAEAEDLTQKLFAGLDRKLAGYEESGRFRAWLRGVAYHMFLTARRAEQRRHEDTLRTGLERDESETSTLFSTAKDRLRALVQQLPPSLREVWDLQVDGLTPDEIAERLGIQKGAVYTRLSRARAMLIDWMRNSPDAM